MSRQKFARIKRRLLQA